MEFYQIAVSLCLGLGNVTGEHCQGCACVALSMPSIEVNDYQIFLNVTWVSPAVTDRSGDTASLGIVFPLLTRTSFF